MSEPLGATRPLTCDLFCRVVDNLGDIGVCWRLARQLAYEHRWKVRLIVDDLLSFARIAPDVAPDIDAQVVHGIAVEHWTAEWRTLEVADVVIEAFACELSEEYLGAMAALAAKPVWINLEYLSAEPWIEGCHGMPSPHPRWPLIKHFFFPGFSSRTGGVLIERGLEARRQAFLADPANRREFLLQLDADPDAEFTVLVFSYPAASLVSLLEKWRTGPLPVQCLLAGDATQAQAATVPSGGALHLRRIDLVPQEQFDQLLWSCDFAIVRGEDSFVRAQLAAMVFAWHAYPQTDMTHLAKLSAFADRYLAKLAPAPAQAWRAFNDAWNRGEDVASIWGGVAVQLDALRAHAEHWRQMLASQGGLADKLARFVAGKLK